MNSPFTATPARDDAATRSLDDVSAWLSLFNSGHPLDLSQYGFTPSLPNISASYPQVFSVPNNHGDSPPPIPMASITSTSVDDEPFAFLLSRSNPSCSGPSNQVSPQSPPSTIPSSPNALVFPQPARPSHKVVVRIQSAPEPKPQLPPGKFMQGGVLVNTNARFQPYCQALPNRVRIQTPIVGDVGPIRVRIRCSN
ncbi:hypothetical protein BC830DRAFT_344404 [Chytriomyces sp. MP71]|nr:hypothetical protein BC830DRAFT_344404 [Chytriomyces sp. MP71]